MNLADRLELWRRSRDWEHAKMTLTFIAVELAFGAVTRWLYLWLLSTAPN